MESETFDRFTRLLGGASSRRATLGAVLGAAFLGTTSDALAKGKGHGKGKGRNHHKGKGHQKRGNDRQKPARLEAEAEPCWRAGSCVPSTGSNVSYCDLEGSPAFHGLNCTRCNASRANLRGIDARGANFTRANLSYACLVDADLTGATIAGNTNLSFATFCRTKMPNGSINNSGCNQGIDCCPSCDAAHPCTVPGQICCHGRCVTGVCCEAADCAEHDCETKACQNFQCAYTNQTDGQPGTQCSTKCCGGACIANDACCTNGSPGCGPGQKCCGGTCIANERCCTNGTADNCPAGQQCCGGTCSACCTNGQPGCPTNQACCGNTCVAGVCCPTFALCENDSQCCGDEDETSCLPDEVDGIKRCCANDDEPCVNGPGGGFYCCPGLFCCEDPILGTKECDTHCGFGT